MNPKQSFQESSYVKEWENIAESKVFRAATEAAVLKLTVDQSPTIESMFEISGAKKLVEILARLHLKPEQPPVRSDRANLRHDV